MYYNANETSTFFILLTKTDGILKQRSVVGLEKDYIVNPGTLLVVNDKKSSDGRLYYRTIDEPIASLFASSNRLAVLNTEQFKLLLPIQSLKDRLFVYRNKELLSDALYLHESETIFVRLRDQLTLEGRLRYKGPVDDSGATLFGIELKEAKGTCDGELNGVRHFKTPSNCAVFVPLNEIRINREDWQKNDLLKAADSGGLAASAGHTSPSTVERRRYGMRGASAKSQSINEYNDLKIGDRVVWPSDTGFEKGIVKWIGRLPDEGPQKEITVGVEFDNAVGTGTGKYKDERLFYTQPGHASLVPLLGLMKASEFSDTGSSSIGFPDQKKSLQQYSKYSNNPLKDTSPNVPAQFNHHLGFLEPVPSAANSASSSMPERSNSHGKSYAPLSHPHEMKSKPKRDPLVVGSTVEIFNKSRPFYGVIRWIGPSVKDPANQNKLTAGVELEEEFPIGTDGTFGNNRYFICKPGRALFVPLNKCIKDRRFVGDENSIDSGYASPDVKGDIPIPEIKIHRDLQLVCGKNKGIQGHHNSCYLDATLFSMFYFSTVFDSIFNRPRNTDDLPQYTEVQQVLKEGIVNPLRKDKYVASQNVWKLRQLLDKLGTVPGMLGEEKDVEEFLSALLSQIMKADPLLHLSTGEKAYFYQLFMEKDEKLVLPSTQKLVDLSFLQANVKLLEVPACLLVQMPRFGKDFKMFRRILPSLELDITDILQNSPRECIVCGELATWECKDCYQVHGEGLNTTAFGDKCCQKSHRHVSRKGHKPVEITIDAYSEHFQNRAVRVIPREKLELFAVVCIQTSHYVAFVKCGPGIEAPWVFFDSMADRIGEQGGYNIPEVTFVPEMANWLSNPNLLMMNSDEDKNLPEHLRRLLCDGYMCMYQSPNGLMFQ